MVLDVSGPEAVRAAARQVRTAALTAVPGAAIHGILVQAMVPGGREVLVGMIHTPHYGPAVVFGVGGALVEILDDAVFRLPPLDAGEVDRMIRESRASLLLEGHRGRVAADLDALRRVLLSIAALAGAGLGVEQIDINPLLVLDDGEGALAVDAVVVLEAAESVSSQSGP